ncbi:MAG: cobaltochelatase subunit CobN [Planctomycetota bacterium]
MEVDPEIKGYWKSFAEENLKRLLIYSSIRYLGAEGEIPPPIPVPKNGFYHPDATGYFTSWKAYLDWYKKTEHWKEGAPFVSIVVQQDYTVWSGASAIYDALTWELEKNGVNVAPIFGGQGSLQDFIKECKPSLLMLQHHSGPEDTPQAGKKSFLEEIDVPYMYSAGYLGSSSIEQWKQDVRGIEGGSGYNQLHRHEYHGIIEPTIAGARNPTGLGYAIEQPIPERIQRIVGRVKSWLSLRNKPEQDKKIAIIYFHKYLGKADIGLCCAGEMARYFDVHESLVEVIKGLKNHGYKIDKVPESSDEIISWMKKSGRNVASWAPGSLQELVEEGDPVLIPEKKYRTWFEQKLSPENKRMVIEKHGEPPGDFMVCEKGGERFIVLPVIKLGNVIMAPQPCVGDIQDKGLIQARKVPPPHNYLAFYWWLQDEFKADAVVHFGAFGSDLFLPGKEVFLSGDCFPDIVIGNMPNIYVWSTSCVGIGIIAKRRSYAVLIDHMVPPILTSGLSPEFVNLQDKVFQFNQVKGGLLKEEYRKTITTEARAIKLDEELRLGLGQEDLLTDTQIVLISDYSERLQEDNRPNKMHILGKVPPDGEAIPFVVHIVKTNSDLFEKLAEAGLLKGPLSDVVRSAEVCDWFEALLVKDAATGDFAKMLGTDKKFVTENLSGEISFAKTVWKNLQDSKQEIPRLFSALDGRFVPPGPGGTPIQRPDVLPTGRNMYGLDPDAIPTREAYEVGKLLTDKYLDEFLAKKGEYPRRVAFQMTGMETFLDMGVMEAQIMYMVGVRPKWGPTGTITGFEVIPSDELNRPRIDPFISIGGIYLKDFPSRLHMLDEAVRLANNVEEENNYLRSNSMEIEKYLLSIGTGKEPATELSCARIFGAPPGQSAVKLIWYIPRSGTWEERKDLLDVRRVLRTHVYTQDLWGENILKLHDRVIQDREVVFSNWGNNLYGPLTNHHYPEETGGLALECEMTGGRKPEIIIQDLRKKKQPRFMLLEDVLNMEMHSTFFNQEWIKGQMEHGYLGATQFMGLADHVFQWESVREGAVWPETWIKMGEIYIRDTYDLQIRDWFDKNNPHAFQEFVATMLEGCRKDYWSPSPDLMREMVTAYADSVARFGYSESAYTGGNEKLQALVVENLNAPGDQALIEKYKAEVAKTETAAALPEEIKGKELKEEKAQKEQAASNDTTITLVVVIVSLAVLFFAYGFFTRKRRSTPVK